MPFPIAPAEIAKTEAKTGFIFPIGMKSKLSKNNGGEVKVAGEYWQLIPFLDTSDRKRVLRTCNDIARETAQMRDWPGFPEDAFVVAQNGSGDYLVLLPEANGLKQLGEVIYFWDHETGTHEAVADSIDAL